MSKSIKQEACQLFIEQEIAEAVEQEDVNISAKAREIAAWLNKLFEVEVSVEAIRIKIQRAKSRGVQSVHPNTTIGNNSEFEDKRVNQDERDTLGRFVNSPGPGRPIKLSDTVSAEFKQALVKEFQEEKNEQKEIRREERKVTALSDGLSKQFIYDVWNIGYISNKVRHPGNIPQEFIENLLYLHTDEDDLIYDPFGGGGPTIDVCNKWHRQYYVSDLSPIPERPEIRKWNLEDGLPDDLVNPKLTFLDPPYYKKKEAEYVDNSISSMDKESYLDFFKQLAENLFARHEKNTFVALIMSNYIDYTNYKNSIWIYDYVNIFKNAGFNIHTWIQCPLSTQQYSAWDVNRAKDNKELLAISRDLVVFVKEGNDE